MTRCLDEATLQSYFDGELSAHLMERASSHLASCVTCAAAARELAEETALMTSALAAEFEVNVPTQALRERVDAAVLGERVANAGRAEKLGLFASLANVFSFSSQRSLGYASLVVVLAFGAIIGVVKLRQTEVPPSQVANNTDKPVVVVPPTPDNSNENEVATKEAVTKEPQAVALNPHPRPVVNRRPAAQKADAEAVGNHVKLIPGERSYLQAIAKLDSSIKSNKNSMRPSLQVEYERNLAVVDRAIAATRNAAKNNPTDTDAADFMFAAYQSKVDLLNTIADARLSGGRSH